jgi:prepilin signal peptidase PulO-like enzyme (type II secretory pathway)
MGGGDAKLAIGMGFILGPSGVFLAIMLASISGSFYGVTNILFNKILSIKKSKITGLKSEIPFGPFLALGTILSLSVGIQIINFYAKVILGL